MTMVILLLLAKSNSMKMLTLDHGTYIRCQLWIYCTIVKVIRNFLRRIKSYLWLPLWSLGQKSQKGPFVMKNGIMSQIWVQRLWRSLWHWWFYEPHSYSEVEAKVIERSFCDKKIKFWKMEIWFRFEYYVLKCHSFTGDSMSPILFLK